MLFGWRNCSSLSRVFLIALLLAAPCANAQQRPPASEMQLSRIEFSGLQSVSLEQAIATSGLKIGQRVDVELLDTVAQRLLDSGLFTNLSYRLRASGNQATVIFKVEEPKGRGGVPVVFDNFIWFTDEELKQAVRREVPSFDGTAPESSSVTGAIARALQQLLQERKIQGQVDYTPSADPAGGNAKHVFSVKGTQIKICGVRFPGATSVQESELIKHAKPLMGSEYSQEFVSAFADANLIPVYRERGHLRAGFSLPSAKPEADSGASCGKGGVVAAVTLPVNEGLSYLWDKAEWTGNESFTPAELEASLAMKSGAVANGLKIDAGMSAVEKVYGKRGFLTARLVHEPVFDDANRRVTYRFSITEGPQYRMGALTITGVSEAEASRLKEKWKLREGDVYDASYLDEFMKKETKELLERAFREGRMRPGFKPPKIGGSIRPNRRTLIVDVVIKFSD
jgi:outer membrane protein assembly factor BamA